MHVGQPEVVVVVEAGEEIAVNVTTVDVLDTQVENVGVVAVVVDVGIVALEEDQGLDHAPELQGEEGLGHDHNHDQGAGPGTDRDVIAHIQMTGRALKKDALDLRRNPQRSAHLHQIDGPGKDLLMNMPRKKGHVPGHVVEQGLDQDHTMMNMEQTRMNQMITVITEMSKSSI